MLTNLLDGLFNKYPGWTRTIAGMVAAATVLASQIPAAAPYVDLLTKASIWLGSLGVVRAGARKLV